MQRVQKPVTSQFVSTLGTSAFGVAVMAAIIAGWIYRDETETYLTAETGIGYLLGICGVTLVLLLLIYPLRKRWRWMRRLGSVKFWFRFHMLCGVLGPTAIIFHSNFRLGSVNGRVAFWSMMIVASSGVVGRYLYTKIHYGLYGERANLRELTQDFDASAALMGLPALPENLRRSVQALADAVRHPPSRFLPSLKLLLWVAPRSHVVELRVRRFCKGGSAGATPPAVVGRFFWLIRKISGFTFFERLFSLWHTLHVPLFVILLLTATVHVIVVNAY